MKRFLSSETSRGATTRVESDVDDFRILKHSSHSCDPGLLLFLPLDLAWPPLRGDEGQPVASLA